MKYPQLVSMPSAVSDWLEEQLEARGIDSEVYTRYILSLLHAHTLDVIYPEEDLSFSQSKKNCEIESLVDELCEKLKEVSSEAVPSPTKSDQAYDNSEEPLKQRKISPKELAEKYYAAFPPLGQKEENSNRAANINLVVSKWPSPEKNLSNIDLIAAKWTSSGSPKKSKRKTKRQPYDSGMKSSRASHTMGRSGCKRAHCVRNLSREMADNLTNWELVHNSEIKNNNNNIKDQCLDSNVLSMAGPDADVDMYEENDENDLPVRIAKDLLKDGARLSDDGPNEWALDEKIIRPRKAARSETVGDIGAQKFLSRGTNITSSIWSTGNAGGTGLDGDGEDLLDFRLGSSLIDNDDRGSWPDFGRQGETNALLESSLPSLSGFAPLPAAILFNQPNFIDFSFGGNECFFDFVTIGLMKLNHCRSRSAFGEFPQGYRQRHEPISRPLGRPFNRPFGRPIRPPPIPAQVLASAPEDLLTSERVRFRPIKTPPLKEEAKEEPAKVYRDGATFSIEASLEEVEFKRSSSGSLFLETEFGEVKRYNEYRWEPPADESLRLPKPRRLSVGSGPPDFKLKFWVSQNDKASQTDDVGLLALADNFEVPNGIENTDGEETMDLGKETDTAKCTCGDGCNCSIEGKTKRRCGDYGSSDSVFDEVVWHNEPKSCKKCSNNNKSTWDHEWPGNKLENMETSWVFENMRSIWDGDEVCRTCLRLNQMVTPLTEQQSLLKEEMIVEGERLLSDLNSVQKAFNASSIPTEADDSKNPDGGPTERKRRHSHMDSGSDVWSFTTRLQEDCLINLSTLPTLRSVTL